MQATTVVTRNLNVGADQVLARVFDSCQCHGVWNPISRLSRDSDTGNGNRIQICIASKVDRPVTQLSLLLSSHEHTNRGELNTVPTSAARVQSAGLIVSFVGTGVVC
eukprot:1872604-Rhodomonas_salina.2